MDSIVEIVSVHRELTLVHKEIDLLKTSFVRAVRAASGLVECKRNIDRLVAKVTRLRERVEAAEDALILKGSLHRSSEVRLTHSHYV